MGVFRVMPTAQSGDERKAQATLERVNIRATAGPGVPFFAVDRRLVFLLKRIPLCVRSRVV